MSQFSLGAQEQVPRDFVPVGDRAAQTELVLFWTELTPFARALVIVAALAVEVFAALQYRAAGMAPSGREQIGSAA